MKLTYQEIREKYNNNNFEKPNYFFHGSSKLLKQVEPNKSHDSDNNKVNIDTAVFVTPSILIASAYSFKDSIKELSNKKGLRWDFNVVESETIPIMTMKNVVVNKNFEGYLYVFVNDGSFVNEPVGSLQYKSYLALVPIDIIIISYQDYQNYYEIRG